MQPGTAYRLKTPTLAITRDSDRRWIPVMLPAGAMLTLVEQTAETLVNVLWKDTEVIVFAVDLDARGEMVEVAAIRS